MHTDFLFAIPSFWSGVARSIDLFGLFTEYNESPHGAMADARALSSDWYIVGEDLVGAMTTIDHEQETPEAQAPAIPHHAAPTPSA